MQQSFTSSSTFNWLNLCLLCCEKENLKKGIKHMRVFQSNSNTVKENILHSAKIRKDAKIESLLASEIDLYSICTISFTMLSELCF